MLERFEHHSPPGPKLKLIGPLALLGALLIAYLGGGEWEYIKEAVG